MIATEERYMLCENGKMFSTGNHPVEMLLPLHHLLAGGLRRRRHHDRRLSGQAGTVGITPARTRPCCRPTKHSSPSSSNQRSSPRSSRTISGRIRTTSPSSSPAATAQSSGCRAAEAVAQTLEWALANDKFIITLCHGPAALLSVSQGGQQSPFKGYSLCVFPDALDKGFNIEIGYPQGAMPWLVAD